MDEKMRKLSLEEVDKVSGGYLRQEATLAEAKGRPGDPVSQDKQLSLISRSFGSGLFCRFGKENRFGIS